MRTPQIFTLTFAVITLLIYFNKPLYAADIKLLFPVRCSLGQSCWILNYQDASFDQSGKDFTCGTRTKPALNSTEIAIRDLKTADQGIFVRAAAEGRIISTRDDVVDDFKSNNVKDCGNEIVIEHENGVQTQYCHLKQGSITVKRGEKVHAGQHIAQIGVSGGSLWPHLGFTVKQDKDYIDPFYGRTRLEGCGLRPKPLWHSSNPMNYQPFAIFNIGFSDITPDAKLIDAGEFDKPANLPVETDTLYLWGSIFGAQSDDEVTLTIYDPNGTVIAKQQTVAVDPLDKTFLAVKFENVHHLLQEGTYQGIIEISRGIGESKKTSKWRRLVHLVKAEN